MILRCQEWDEKSDLWSIACLIIEIYSGKLLFNTHSTYEHLAMIEKVSDNIPIHMVKESPK